MVLLALLALASAAPVHPINLTSANFDAVIADGRSHLVHFSLPFPSAVCDVPCRRLAWEVNKLAESLKPAVDIVEVGSVDVLSSPELAARFGVRTPPAIRWHKHGDAQGRDYDLRRTALGMLNFINSELEIEPPLSLSPVKVHIRQLDTAGFEAALGSGVDIFAIFFVSWCQHCEALVPELKMVAEAFSYEPHTTFAVVDCEAEAALCERYQVSGYPTIRFFLHNHSGGIGEVYTGAKEATAMVDFLNERTGAYRDLGGHLLPKSGRYDDMDDWALRFLNEQTAVGRSAVMAEFSAAVGGPQDPPRRRKVAQYYRDAMEKCLTHDVRVHETDLQRWRHLVKRSFTRPHIAGELDVSAEILEFFLENAPEIRAGLPSPKHPPHDEL